MLTREDVTRYRDRIFATTEYYDLENLTSEILVIYGDLDHALQVREGTALEYLTMEIYHRSNSQTLYGLMLCCAAQYYLCNGYGDYIHPYGDLAPEPADSSPSPHLVQRLLCR